MNCDTTRDRETYRFYQAAINALELRCIEDAPGCTLPPAGFTPRPCKDTALTAFAQLGALRLNANRGLISLLDGRYQYILAEATRTLSLLPTVDSDPNDDLWLGSVIIPRTQGICEHVLSLGDMITDPTRTDSGVPAVVINDLAEDPRFGLRSYVRGEPRVRFYAGVPLCSPWGTIIGAYCVFGHEPRDGLMQEQLLALQGIATTVMKYLETSKAKEGHQRYEQMLHGLTSFVTGETSIHSLDDPQRAPSKQLHPVWQHSSSSVVAQESTGSSSDDPPSALPDIQRPQPHGIQSPKSKKRPRLLSTAIATARKRSTVSLQEDMLPSGSKTMFSRAASIMRESIDVCGCVIFDASMATYGAAINNPHRRSSVEPQLGNAGTFRYDRASDEPLPKGEIVGVGTQTSSSDGDGLSNRKACEVLGFCIKESAGISIEDPETFSPDLTEKDLRKLLKRYPMGHVFNVSSAGDISPSQAPSSPPEMAPSSENIERTTSRMPGSKTGPGNRDTKMLRKLLKVAPGARSISVLPLWDYQRNRWFAGCICWTTEPSRVLYPDVDLIYLQAFSNSIMMELSRLDAITSDQAKTTFVASISHELRCPLHGILGGVQFLQDTSLDAYQAGMLDSVAMCGKTLLDTIDHVLDFAKVNTFTKLPLNTSSTGVQEPADLRARKSSQSPTQPASLFANMDLAMLTEEVVEAVFAGQSHRGALARFDQVVDQSKPWPVSINKQAGGLARERDKTIRVVLDIPHRSNWTVTAQPGAWRRVVMNLFGNALKYTTSGHVRISMRMKETELDSSQEPKNIDVTFAVSDSGKGMSTEYLRSGLWRPFSQEDSFSPGTGLGLSIVRQIVQGMKGNIDLKSELQAGTEVKVHLSLPLAENPSGTDEEDQYLPLAASQLRNRPVCILETTDLDDLSDLAPSVQKVRHELGLSLSRTLKGWFGADAVVSTLLTAISADVVICLEPQTELLSTIKSLASPERRPLVILIALHVAEATKLRADPRVYGSELVVDVITQPCGPRKLAKALTQAMDRRDKQMPLTVTPLASPINTSSEDLPVREWRSPSWLPTHLGNAQSNSCTRSNSNTDPNTISRTPVERKSAHTSVHEPPTAKYLRILLVDDNRINLSLLTAFMRRYNFGYQEAMNGLQAVETYKRAGGKFDYVLMDLTMPVMDGMEATREIRRHELREGWRPTVVIALTGLASAAARVEALSSGINYFLTKPVKFQALHQMLKGTASAAGAGAGGGEMSPP